jgi:glutathione S-transferase
MTPILYSFRRCPFAIRARIALNYSSIELQLREVLLRKKPKSMLQASAKATVPVLVLADGSVIDESIDIMRWALAQKDPDAWWRDELADSALALVEQCDIDFKIHLDHYKYADRHPQHPQRYYRQLAELFLQILEHKLTLQRFLFDDRPTFADVAIFPFIRQFAMVDKVWFDQSPYPRLQTWLQWFLSSVLFTDVMTKYPLWQEDVIDD